LTLQNTRFVTLSDSNSQNFTGTTDLRAGTLVVNGHIGGVVNINAANATLAGTGTVGGITAVSGTLSPGQPDPRFPGALNLDHRGQPGISHSAGNVSLSSSTTYLVQRNGKGVRGTTPPRPNEGTDYDQLDVTGTFAANGAGLLLLLGVKSAVD